MKYSLGISPELRSNFDFIFLLGEDIITNRKKLYDHYAGMFPTFEIFCQVMDQCTQDYECLVIHNNAKSNKLEDQVFWYKASDHEDFRVGSSEMWEYSTRHCDDGSDEYQELIKLLETKDDLSLKEKESLAEDLMMFKANPSSPSTVDYQCLNMCKTTVKGMTIGELNSFCMMRCSLK